jgi:hypothetical protein
MKILLTYLIFSVSSVNARAPEWFSDYLGSNPACEQELLCAVGSGSSLADALGEARSEVAKFFQAKIQSKSQISTSTEQKGQTASSGTFDEWTNKVVSVETSELISGLEIKKQAEVDGIQYVLMSLNRAKTAGIILEKIQEIDTENAQLMELDSRFAYPKILKNLRLVDIYRDRYSLISSKPITFKVKKETLQAKINKLPSMNLAIVTKGQKLPAKLGHTLIELLAPLKVVIVSKKSSPAFFLKGEIITEEQYFNVAGFKKLNVVYKLELCDSKNKVFGKMSVLSEQVARNSDQAIEKAIPEIKEALQENLDQLSSK